MCRADSLHNQARLKNVRLLRSPGEIRFRLGQELWNLAAFLSPPQPPSPIHHYHQLVPPPAASAGFLSLVPDYCQRVLDTAALLARGRLPVLGTEVPLPSSHTDWHCDPLAGRSAPTVYFRRIPYLNAARVGDHKVIWEMNRHQHLVLLAQAACLEPNQPQWLNLLVSQLESWWRGNLFHRGINWASALEVAFRALSWIWILQFVGARLPASIRQQLLASLYQHGAHLARNLSIYFAPNTHLIGEAVCLHALGCLLADLPVSAHWKNLGAEWVDRCMHQQVLNDGAHFEQSSFYHLYSVDLFLLHALLRPEVSATYREKLWRMCNLLHTVTDLDGSFPLLGDDDGGRLFHPFGPRRFFPRASLTLASFFFQEPQWRFTASDYAEIGLWWMGPRSFFTAPLRNRACGVFTESGIVVAGDEKVQIVFTARAFGSGTAGHSHAHGLHFILRHQQKDLLLDSGTFTYVSDRATRNRFRSNSAHNTIRVDHLDQATPVGPFRWGPDRAVGQLLSAEVKPGYLRLKACLEPPNRDLQIERQLSWSSGDALRCEDEVRTASGAPDPQPHRIELFWQLPSEALWCPHSRSVKWPCGAVLEMPSQETLPTASFHLAASETSDALYHRSPSQTLCLAFRSPLPVRWLTRIRLP